jgi:hypothetical protein
MVSYSANASLAQSVERETLNLKVAGSTPAWGFLFCFLLHPRGHKLSLINRQTSKPDADDVAKTPQVCRLLNGNNTHAQIQHYRIYLRKRHTPDPRGVLLAGTDTSSRKNPKSIENPKRQSDLVDV